MRILLMWPDGKPEVKILLDTLTSAGHEIVYWVGEYAGEHMIPKGAIFHDHYDAWDAKPAQALAHTKIPPVSAEYIASMYETESTILTMMNKHYDRAPVDERKHIYYTMLAYWKYVLDTVKPEYIIFNDVPHSIYSNIFHDVAGKRGIPMLSFENTSIARLLILYRDFWNGSDDLRSSIARARTHGTTIDDLHPEVRAYWQEHSKKNALPEYMIERKRSSAGRRLWGHRMHIALSFPRKALPRAAALMVRFFLPNLRKEYEPLVTQPTFERPYVYFPLSFQPERTTSPQGGVFTDQILAVETLSAALPDGWEIYVKEHPSQWWDRSKTRYSSARYPGYYERIARIPHTRLVPIHTDTFLLGQRAKAIATITGSAGWEGLLRGKRCFLFGIPWYRDCPGAMAVRNVEDCKKAFIEVQKSASVGESEILAFLKAIGDVGTRGSVEQDRPITPSDIAANMKRIGEAICTELKAIST